MKTELKNIKGNVLGIGLTESLTDILGENNNIDECYLMNSDSKNTDNSRIYTKTINIRKIKKFFCKKNFDYIICNFEQIKPYFRSFIKNSIYLNRKKIYYYNINDFELKELENRYNRYNSTFEKKKDYVIIDNELSKTNFFKNIWFYFRDLIYDVIDYIGNLFVN